MLNQADYQLINYEAATHYYYYNLPATQNLVMTHYSLNRRLQDFAATDALGGIPPNTHRRYDCKGKVTEWTGPDKDRTIRVTNTNWTMNLPPEVWRIIRSYLNEYHPLLGFVIKQQLYSWVPRPLHYDYAILPTSQDFDHFVEAFMYWRKNSPIQRNWAGQRTPRNQLVAVPQDQWRSPLTPEYELDPAIPPVQFGRPREPTSRNCSSAQYLAIRCYNNERGFEIMATVGYCCNEAGKPCKDATGWKYTGCSCGRGFADDEKPVNHVFYRLALECFNGKRICRVSVHKTECALLKGPTRDFRDGHISSVRWIDVYHHRTTGSRVHFGSWADQKDCDLSLSEEELAALDAAAQAEIDQANAAIDGVVRAQFGPPPVTASLTPPTNPFL